MNTDVWNAGKTLRRLVSFLLIFVLFVTMMPLSEFRSTSYAADNDEPYAKVWTTYGIATDTVFGYRIKPNDNTTVVKVMSSLGILVLREKLTGTSYKFYLVGKDGEVMKDWSVNSASDEPELEICYSPHDTSEGVLIKEGEKAYPYYLVSVTDPNTGKVDIYNPDTGAYYNHQLDSVMSQAYDYGAYALGEKDDQYTVLTPSGDIAYSDLYYDSIDAVTLYDNVLYFCAVSDDDTCTALSSDGKLEPLEGFAGIDSFGCAVGQNEYEDGILDKYLLMSDESGLYSLMNVSTGSFLSGSHHYDSIKYAGDGVFYGMYSTVEAGYDNVDRYMVMTDTTSFDVAKTLGYNRCEMTCDLTGANGNLLASVYNVDRYGDVQDWKDVIINRYGEIKVDDKAAGLYHNYYLHIEADNSYSLRSLESDDVIMEDVTFGFEDGMFAGNFLLVQSTSSEDEGKMSWFNCKTGRVVLEDVSSSFRFFSQEKGAGYIVVPEEDSGRCGIIDTVNGKFSGYITSYDLGVDSYDHGNYLLSHTEPNDQGVIILSDANDEGVMVLNRSFVGVKSFTDAEVVSSDHNHNYLICDKDKGVYYVVKRDGTMSSAFYLHYKSSYRGHNLTITNKSGSRFGIASADGTVILPVNYNYAGYEFNGLSPVVDDANYDGYGEQYCTCGYVDYYGEWLIKGKYNFDDEWDMAAGRNLVLQGSSGYYYFYDFSDYINDLSEDIDTVYYDHRPDNRITEDDLYGPYSAYLFNNAYDSMANRLSGGAESVFTERTRFDNGISILISNMKEGGVSSYINALKCDLTGKYYKQDELEEQLAMDFIQEMSQNDSFMSDMVKTFSSKLKWTERFYQIIKAGCQNAAEKRELAEMLSSPTLQEIGLTESNALRFIRATEANWKKVDTAFDIAGEVVNTAEVASTVIIACGLNRYIVKKLLETVDQDSALGKGLTRIQTQQYYPAEVIIEKMLLKGVFSQMSKQITKHGVGRLASLYAGTGGIKVGMATTIASMGYYILGSVLNKFLANSDDVISAYIAYENSVTLGHALSQTYTSKIRNSDDGLKYKEDYILIYKAYVAALKFAAEKALVIAKKGQNKDELQRDYDQYKNRLTYEAYIDSCIANANAGLKYTVNNGKATIVGYNSSSKPTKSLNTSMGGKTLMAEDNTTYIDIPETVDGYEVEAVSKSAFRNNQDIAGVYIPQGVVSIGERTFEGCSNLSDVFLEEGLLSIGKQAFRDCTSLSGLTLPKSITDIGESVFDGINEIKVKTGDTSVINNYVENSSDNVSVEEIEPALVSIEITKPADKQTYMMSELAEIEAEAGENDHGLPDLTGLELEATYEDGARETVTSGMAGYFETKALGESTVTVLYGDQSTTYTVNVEADYCKWELICVDEYGDEIAERETDSLKAGTFYVSSALDIEGYELVSNRQIKRRMGADNRFIAQYKKKQKPSIYDAEVTLSKTNYVYTGKAAKPAVTVTYNGEKLTGGQDYTVTYDSNVRPGNAAAVIEGAGEYEGMAISVFRISKAANKMTAKSKTVKVKYRRLKKKTQKIKKAKAFTIRSAKGKVKFKLKKKDRKAKSKITITKTGIIKIKKGLKKGKYKIKVAVTAAGNFGYKPKTKQLYVTIRVK